MIDKKKIWFYINSGGGFTAEYTALLARATALGYTLPGASIQSAQNALIVALKAAGIWPLLDVFYVMMANDANLGNFSLLNWITPASYALTATNSPTYAAGGYTGNGTTQYLPSSYNPTANAVNLSLNSASYFVYSNTNSTNPKAIMGGGITGASQYRLLVVPKYDATLSSFVCNSSTLDNNINSAGSGITTSVGLWHLLRSASTDYNVYQNGTLRANIVQVSSVLPTTFEFMAVRTNLSPALFSTRQISMGGAGSGAISPSSLSTAWNNYKTAIGL